MITRCWENLRTEDLIHAYVCDCQSECNLKAKLVDLLLDALDADGLDVAAAVGRLATRSVPNFAAM